MVKKLILTLLCLLLCTCCFAESDFPAYDYLISLGYSPTSIADSPGWKTCNLMEDYGCWTLTVSNETDCQSLMVLPEFDSESALVEMQALFVDIVERFEWDISFYWPEHDSGAKIAKSFNIKKDIDKTSDNYMSKADYVSALRKEFGLDEDLVVESRRTISLGDLEYSVPTGWAYDYSDEYRMHYHYVTGDPFTGGYFSTKCDVLDDSEKPDNAEAAEELLVSVVDGISNGLVNNEYEIIDLRYPELSGFQSKAISGTFAAYKEQGYENLSYFWTAVSGNTVYTFSYTNVMASDVYAKSEFEDLLATVALKNNEMRENVLNKSEALSNIPISDDYSPQWLAESYNASSNEAFLIRAEYHEEIDVFTYILQSTDIPTGIWNACDVAVRMQYKDHFNKITKAARDSLDGLGYHSTTVIATYQLCDGNAVYMMIDGQDFSHMIND